MQGGPGEVPLVIERELPPTQAGDPDRLGPLIAEALRGGGGSVLIFCASRRQCQVCKCAVQNLHNCTPSLKVPFAAAGRMMASCVVSAELRSAGGITAAAAAGRA